MNRQVCKLLFLCLLALSTVSGCGDNASSQSPAATEPIPTTQPTPTPEPTPTVQPTATPIPGWEKIPAKLRLSTSTLSATVIERPKLSPTVQ